MLGSSRFELLFDPFFPFLRESSSELDRSTPAMAADFE
jgi:hypothetical protein